jgi:hypothetical protein
MGYSERTLERRGPSGIDARAARPEARVSHRVLRPTATGSESIPSRSPTHRASGLHTSGVLRTLPYGK